MPGACDAGAAAQAATRGECQIAIVVPLLNEAAQMDQLLPHLLAWQAAGCEVVAVDGGSDDGGAARLRDAGLPVLQAPCGRARQMNAGARASRAPVLLFLHADTRLPGDAVHQVQRALGVPGACWGRFDVRIEGDAWLLPWVARLMNLRSRLSGIATGDQAMFATRAAFESVGGFPDQPLMEDIELSRHLRRLARPRCLRSRVLTSGRRWQQRGVLRTIVLMWRLRLAYWLGTPAARLAQRYR